MKSPLLPRDTLGFEDASVIAIKRWRLLLVFCFGLMALAAMAWGMIPRREDPKVEVPVALVLLVYPGASPEDIESQVIKVAEDELASLEGVKQITSFARPSVGSIAVLFRDNVKIDSIAEKVRNKVQSKMGDMPQEVKPPEVSVFSTDLTPQMVVAVVGNRSDDVLTAAANRLKVQLSGVAGLAGIDLRGDQQRAVRVQLDPARLEKHGVSAEAVVRQLQLANVRIPAGELKIGPLVTTLQVNQEFSDAQSVIKVPVGGGTDAEGVSQVVTLGNVAEVKDGALALKERFMVDGQPAVALELRFRGDQNAVLVGERVRHRIDEVRAGLPEGASIHIAHDQPQWVAKGVTSFLESLGEGIALVMIVITLGMGWRAALVVSGVLPLAAGGAILGLYVTGFSLDQISIAGLIVALGLLVDDAVVVTESIQIMRDQGVSSTRASVFGTARVFWANNGTTAVACASFIPLFFMGGPPGDFIKPLPAGVILALLTSLLVAQFFTPWASTRLLKNTTGAASVPDSAPFDRTHDTNEHHEEKNPVIRFLKDLYVGNIGSVVRNPVKVIAVFTVLLVGNLVMLPRIGIEFFPKAEKPAFFVTVELPRGTREEVTAEKVAEVVAIIQKQPEVETTSAVVGGNYPRVITTHAADGAGKNFGDIFVRLRGNTKGDPVAARLRTLFGPIVGANVSVDELFFGSPVANPVQVRISGDDYSKLRIYGGAVAAHLREIEGTTNVKDSLTETIPVARIVLDADKAKRVGLTPGQVGNSLRALYGEDKVTEFRNGDNRIQVVLEPRPAPESPLGFVAETTIQSTRGGAVPLRQAGDISLDRGFAQLSHFNTRRTVDVTAGVHDGVLPGEVVAKLDPWMRAQKWDSGYDYSYGGAAKEIEDSFKNLGLATIGALLTIFVLLVLMFDSFTLAVVVIIAVPYAMIGVVTGLAITHNSFGFMSFLGLIALMGVYVNHKIYFVDRMQELLHRGQDLATAMLHAGQDRLRPVVLTALTAILGLLPLTLGGERTWSAFGWVNVFGLAVSIPLSLVLLPAFISLAYRLRGFSVDRPIYQKSAPPEPSFETVSLIPDPPTAAPPAAPMFPKSF